MKMTLAMTVDEQIDPETGDPYLRVVTTDDHGNQTVERY